MSQNIRRYLAEKCLIIATDDSGELLSAHIRVVFSVVELLDLSCCVRFHFHRAFPLNFTTF